MVVVVAGADGRYWHAQVAVAEEVVAGGVDLSGVPPRKRGKVEKEAAEAAAAAKVVGKARSGAVGSSSGEGAPTKKVKKARLSEGGGGDAADGAGAGEASEVGSGKARGGDKLPATSYREMVKRVINAVANASERSRKAHAPHHTSFLTHAPSLY